MPNRNKKLSQQRYIVIVVTVSALITIGLTCAIIGIQAPLFGSALQSDQYSELPRRAGEVLRRLSIEQGVACDFVTRAFDGETDTERQSALVVAQQNTMMEVDGLLQHYADVFPSDATDDVVDPSIVFPYASLMEVHIASLKRTQTPAELSVSYQLAKQRILQVLFGVAARTSAPRHAASISSLLMSNLMFVEASERVALTSSLRQGRYDQASLSQLLELENLLHHQCALYLGITRGGAAATDLVIAMQANSRLTASLVGSLATFPSTWVGYIEPSDVTAGEIGHALPVILETFIQRQEAIVGKTARPTVQYSLSLGLCLGMIVCVLAALFLALRKLALNTLAKEVDAEHDVYVETLGKSYERVSRFLASVVRLDISSIRGVEGKVVQGTEREVYVLEQHVKSVLRLLHPAVPRWRTLKTEVRGEVGLHTPPVPRQLVAIPSTVLLIDLSVYQIQPTGETIKSYPSTMCTLLQGISTIVEAIDGVVHDISATRLVIVWNLTTVNVDHEMSACHAAVAIQKTFSTEAVPLRFAIVTGALMCGVAGSESYRPFVVLGKPLALAGHLLRIAHLHDVSACIDTTTFSTLDSQQFLTRPLEVLALQAEGGRNTTPEHVTVHELVCAASTVDRDGRLVLWNRAFEASQNGQTAEGISMLKEYRRQYGNSRSVQRLMALLLLRKPVSTIGDLQDGLL